MFKKYTHQIFIKLLLLSKIATGILFGMEKLYAYAYSSYFMISSSLKEKDWHYLPINALTTSFLCYNGQTNGKYHKLCEKFIYLVTLVRSIIYRRQWKIICFKITLNRDLNLKKKNNGKGVYLTLKLFKFVKYFAVLHSRKIDNDKSNVMIYLTSNSEKSYLNSLSL